MIERYEDETIKNIWSKEAKVALWDQMEISAIRADVRLGKVTQGQYQRIRNRLKKHPVDITWWEAREKETKHDLGAYVEERRRHLTPDLQPLFHRAMTSYDTEEGPLAVRLRSSAEHISILVMELLEILRQKAIRHRYQPMVGRSHDQLAELQTLGKRHLNWLTEILPGLYTLESSIKLVGYSRMAGAIGNYAGTSAEREKLALKYMKLSPYPSSTQIVPRGLHAPMASAVQIILSAVAKMGGDIRRGSRGPKPIYQEPFSREQIGSSAMPHKRNPINSENAGGQSRLGLGYMISLFENIFTVEERAIEQSSVERVAWPDLFHVTAFTLKRMTRVIRELVIYPENLLWEIAELGGCYATNEVKSFLAPLLLEHGISAGETYRLVQLAAFNVHPFPDEAFTVSLEDMDGLLERYEIGRYGRDKRQHIRDLIYDRKIKVVDGLKATQEDVDRWNEALMEVFADLGMKEKWEALFKPSNLLREEQHCFEMVENVFPK